MNEIEKNPVSELLKYYRRIYQSKDPIKEILKVEGEIPKSVKEKIQSQFSPEPFYGYKDALLLLINPGEVSSEKNVCSDEMFNKFHKDRYLNWTRKEYLEEGERLKEIHRIGNKWREKRREEINNIVSPEEVPFMHTMEFFPYHSKQFNFGSKTNMEWMCDLKTSELLMKSIKYIAEHNKVKYIFGIGLPWVTIFEYYRLKPCEVKEWKNPNTGKYRFRLFKYKFEGNSVPVIISILGSGRIALPKNSEVVEVIRKML
ncbi:hypothetical protein [Clostridium sp. BL-8]|uniref:hypothetical protein n=1 Tax=Clostridium sp. BL-8 TaxID=349938 RepID=UPI00098CA9F4|nr:hypothetical protein [Clostridium sp. BL-8]OOM78801.1 hypothetical protein CLOBL_20490 [Clostridium sp. BL-8]